MTTRSLVASVGVALVALALAAPGAGAYPYGPCEKVYVDPDFAGSPRVVRETISFDGAEQPFEVLLPTDYGTSGARYPVLYLLHGFSQDEDSWLVFGDIERFTAPFTAGGRAAIVVMPRIRGLAWDTDYRSGQRKWESLLTRAIVPFVDANFRTIADGRHRAVAGLSGGAVTSSIFLAHRPDVFAIGGSFSGLADNAGNAPVGPTATFLIDRYHNACAGGGPTEPGEAGDPVRDELWAHDIDPVDLAPNMRGSRLYVGNGDGTPCDLRDIREYPTQPTPATLAVQSGEVALYVLARQAATKLEQQGVPVTEDFGCGLHTWRYFRRELVAFWPLMISEFAKPAPATFDYRRALATFTVYGWTFTADPHRAAEFLEVADAGPDGVTLTGSGLTTVTTGPLFAPGAPVGLSGAVQTSVTADADGRLTFTVDLGPAHRDQQYTLQAKLAGDGKPGYFTTRHVVFGGSG